MCLIYNYFIMCCPFSYFKVHDDASHERVICCNHPHYYCNEVAEKLKELGKTFVPNKECQFVGSLSYESCPLYKLHNSGALSGNPWW